MTRFFAVLAILIMGASTLLPAVAYAQSSPLESIITKTEYYDPGYNACTSGLSADSGTASITLPNTIPEPHKTLFSQAAATFKVNPQFIAALFLSENGNVWKPFDSHWSSSPAGASGPFQFMPGTWSAYQTDGNNDGTKDINNIYDAAYSAANLASKSTTLSTPLGDISKPFVPNTLIYSAAAYNWGGGNLQQKTKPDSPLSVAPKETQEYVSNVYMLISSGFTKSGKSTYPDPKAPASGTVTSSMNNQTPQINGCISGAVAGSIVQTAVNYAWPEYHPPNYLTMKPEYASAIAAAKAAGKYVGGGSNPGIDCGGFVTRVMQDSGVDPNYGGGGNTDAQEKYMKNHPELYERINPKSTADLQPGDIAINDTHTYFYVGQVAGFNSTVASASFSTTNTSWRAPMAGREKPADPSFNWYRHK